MVKNIVGALIGGGLLSAASLVKESAVSCISQDVQVDIDRCNNVAENQGFPFSFLNDNSELIGRGQEFLQNQFQLAPALANLIFWAVVAAVVIKVLAWVLEKFSLLIFVAVIIALGASYFGLLKLA